MSRSKSLETPPPTGPIGNPPDLRLRTISSQITGFQRELLNYLWINYQANEKWPHTRTVHSKFTTQAVRESLRSLSGDIVREVENSPNDTLELSLLGVLMTDESETYRSLLLRYLEFLRQQFIKHPDQIDFTNKQIQEHLTLSDAETLILGKLIRLGSILGLANWNSNSWTIRVPKEVDYLPPLGPLDNKLDEWLFRHYQQTPVFLEDARRFFNQKLTLGSVINLQNSPSSSGMDAIDPLKRRYQVFVSSTYEDLKEERQQVIQALLETKCIPMGMELFPATSSGQWALIKRVIDDCDYYIVVIAARYGSLDEAQLGYTEREFDYATSIGKPVIGFFHSSPDSLPVSKSEKTDEGRARLRRFVEKVKGKLCRPWSSAAELGSAVKSAILHELEYNPKPGWVRADAITTSAQVEKLKQRIADLEERLKKRTREVSSGPKLDSDLSVPFSVIASNAQAEPDILDVKITFSGAEVFIICAQALRNGGYSETLREKFFGLAQEKIEAAISAEIGKSSFRVLEVPREEFEQILHTFVAQKLLKVSSEGWTARQGAYLEVTAKGLQRLSESKVEQNSISKLGK